MRPCTWATYLLLHEQGLFRQLAPNAAILRQHGEPAGRNRDGEQGLLVLKMLAQHFQRRGGIALLPTLGGEQIPGTGLPIANRKPCRFMQQQGNGGTGSAGPPAQPPPSAQGVPASRAPRPLAINQYGTVFNVQLRLPA